MRAYHLEKVAIATFLTVSTTGCLPKRPRRVMLEAGGEAMDAHKTGALIAQTRKERGLTQKELSQALHVSAQAVSKWERGVSQS